MPVEWSSLAPELLLALRRRTRRLWPVPFAELIADLCRVRWCRVGVV